MTAQADISQVKKSLHISLDTWAVVVALLAAFMVRVGFFKHVPW